MAKEIRERIITAALREINCRGTEFHMDDLARNLRISKRTLYEQFSSKQDIIKEALFSLMHTIHNEHLQMMANENLSTEDKIIQFFNFRSPDISILSVRRTTEILAKMPELQRALKEAHRQDWELLSQLLDQALQEEDFKDFDKSLLIHMLESATNDILEYFDEIRHDYSFPEYMEKCVRIILYGIKKTGGI